MAALDHADCGAHPGSDLLLYHRIRPVSDNHFALDSHTGHDMTVLSVTMRRLVFIHEIHIDGIIWDLFIELCM